MNPPLLDPSQTHVAEAHLGKLLDMSTAERPGYLAGLADDGLRAILEGALAKLPPIDELPRGFRCNNFQLTGEQPRKGGFGVVYRAHQLLMEEVIRNAAVKFIRPELLRKGPATAQRHLRAFAGELKRLIGLDHPHIVKVIDGGVSSDPRCPDVPWFAMEYLEISTDLIPAPVLKDRPARLGCFQRVCDAVGPDGNPKVIDFGLGEWLRPERPHMPWLLNRGTLPYMAPEQLDGELGTIDARTDVHALGILLYQILTTHLPYALKSSTEEEIRGLICEPDRLPLSKYWAHADSKLEAIVARAFHWDPAQRFPDAGELSGALDAWMNFPRTTVGGFENK
jgi:serine/threonine-protein kinase